MKTSTSTRYSVSDIVSQTGAGETTVRRYLRAYQASHRNVNMRSGESWSLNTQTFNTVVRQIRAVRSRLNLD